MGHKPWNLPWRRQEKRQARQRWKAEVEAQLGPLTSLEDVIAEYGFTQAEIDAAED